MVYSLKVDEILQLQLTSNILPTFKREGYNIFVVVKKKKKSKKDKYINIKKKFQKKLPIFLKRIIFIIFKL